MPHFSKESLPLKDFAGHLSSTPYLYATPDSIEALQQLVQYANAHTVPVRIRANAHSMNSLAIPHGEELVISMRDFCRYRFDSEDTVTFGAGCAVWDANQALAQYGLELLVYNDGGAAASSLGGFMSAGGIGYTSNWYGGFWNSVEKITFVTGAGELREITRDAPEFKWLFGSMGQLGVAAELTLKVKSLDGQQGKAPVGTTGMVEASHYDWKPTIWYTLFVPHALWKTAKNILAQLDTHYRDVWAARAPYIYRLPFRDFNPPLIHPHQGELVAVGIWGEEPEGGFDWEKVACVEADIQKLVTAKPRLIRRYAQTEKVPPGFYRDYFDRDIYEAFRELKRVFDPDNLFSKGVF